MPKKDFQKNIKQTCADFIDQLRSGTNMMYITTTDEASTLKELRKCVSSLNLDSSSDDHKRTFGYYEWSSTQGIIQGILSDTDESYINMLDGKKEKKAYTMEEQAEKPETNDLMQALTFFSRSSPSNQKHNFDCHVIVLKDVHSFFRDNKIIRKIKDIIIQNEDENVVIRRTIVVISPVKNIPIELNNLLSVIEWKLPTQVEVSNFLTNEEQHVLEVVDDSHKLKKTSGVKTQYAKSELEKIVFSLSGLSLPEIDNVCSLSRMRFGEIMPDFLMEQKKQIILKSGLLEYHDTSSKMSEVGGMDCLKEWVSIRKRAFSKEARDYGIETPKGLLMVGIQGCGKSLLAKAIASVLEMPLLRFDVGKVFSKTVGSSEENIRSVISLIESVAPCVVMIDEIEKGLAGVQSSNQSDGGTTARVIGTLLSWLNDKTCPAFVVATANNIRQLPPELHRKGRFDEIFFVPLPEENERKEIFEIHLRKRNREPEEFNVKAFAELSDKFSGAECEEVIKSALITAFSVGKELDDMHIIRAINEMIPLYRTCQEDLDYLYKWVDWNKEKEDGVRARFASSARKNVSKKQGDNIIRFGESETEKNKG